jgi:hypothetical protein
MSIRKIDKNKWEIDYYPQGRKGKRKREVFYGTEAEAKEFELQVRRQNAGLPNPTNPKIMDVIPEYMEWVKIHQAEEK